jgi:hypothetical protein
MPFNSKTLLQLKAIEPGERKVQYQATWSSDGRPAEKLLRGNKGLDVQALVTKQELE